VVQKFFSIRIDVCSHALYDFIAETFMI